MNNKDMRHTAIGCLIATAMLVLAGCGRKVLYADSMRVDEKGWDMSEKCYFDVEAEDTLASWNFFVDVRNACDYPYSNLFLFVETTYPDGSLSRDTLECPLAAPDGSWLGKQSGHYVSNRYYLRKGVRFPLRGEYRFAVGHGMRDTVLAGVKNIGLKIERDR